MGLDHYIVRVRKLTDDEIHTITSLTQEVAEQLIPSLTCIQKDALEAEVEDFAAELS
jgi:hypothetical protein